MGSKNEFANVEKIKEHFENSTENKLRGSSTPAAINNYAQFILEKLQISEGRILDVGCGDGRIMEQIQKINPKLSIDGVELTSTLSNTARLLNPKSEIFNQNAINLYSKKKYDRIFSFSFAQYLSSKQFLDLNNRLVLFLTKVEGAKIVHLSIPDWGLRNANYYVEYAKQNRLFLFPGRFILNAINFKRSYGNDGSRYHDPR
jgi:trans-aconitate methyltransferase